MCTILYYSILCILFCHLSCIFFAKTRMKDELVTHVALTQSAAEARCTLTLEVIESVQAGGPVETRAGLALVYLRLTPEHTSAGS